MGDKGGSRRTMVARLGGALAACGLVTGLFGLGEVARAAAPRPAQSTHAYRHGLVPMIGRHQPGVQSTSANNLSYGGGISGVGVTSGPEHVYLVFWGSQWGGASTGSSGYTTFSGDPSGMAPDLQAFFTGLGTGNETWSGVMTQYCEGVAWGSQTCPSSAAHVGYPTGGALAGVWEDTSAAAPAVASGHQIGEEAVSAATHFGNTTQSSNRDAQYVVVSPTGTDPDNYQSGGFCAWHDYTGDASLSGGGVSSPDGLLAFTNLPYVTDAGASCGQGFVNNPGTLDGVTIVEGHEYAETITDQFPAGGWTDPSGAENGDKCAWISSGQGASQNITLRTGTFAVQSTWANDYNGISGGCEVSHPIVSDGNAVSVTNPGRQTSRVGSPASLQIGATDSASGQTLTYSATGLPAGLAINSASGLVSGTPKTAASYSVTVKATDTTNSFGSASFTWVVDPSGGGGIRNGGFESGTLSRWTASGTAGVTKSGPHSGAYAARLGSRLPTKGDSSISQRFTAPSGVKSLSFWYDVTCPDTVKYGWATATLKDDTTGMTTTALRRTCVLSSGWRHVTIAIRAGHTYTLKLTNHDDDHPGDPTSTKYDDVRLGLAAPSPIVNRGVASATLPVRTASGAVGSTTSALRSGGQGRLARPTRGTTA